MGIGSRTSPLKEIQCGVPQGSILGPILFLIYINDISKFLPQNSLTIFADDTSLFTKSRNVETLEQNTFEHLNVLSQYFSNLKLKINPQKTQVVHFGTRQRLEGSIGQSALSPQVVLDDELIAESLTVDYLGVRLDGHLSWNDQIEKLSLTLSRNLFVLRNVARLENVTLSKMVYHSMLESHIRYSIVLWGSSSKTNLNKIFCIQKRAIRVILKLRADDSCVEHFKELDILTVPSLFFFETVSYVREQNLIAPHAHTYDTRNRNINPSVQHKLKLFEQKPSYIGLKLYSFLPTEIKDITCIKKFKLKLKQHLIQKCYYDLPTSLPSKP
jgi:hypothetical protein